MNRTINFNNFFRLKTSFLFLVGILLILVACKSSSTLINNRSVSSNSPTLKEYTLLEIDGFGNTYLLTTNNVLEKYDPKQNLLFTYSFNRQGEVTRVDASNPQKILVYFQQFQNVVFLDNTLSVIKTLNLEALGYWQVNAVSLSNDNLIWIYDPTIHQLIKINEDGENVLASNELFDDSINDNVVNRIMNDSQNVFIACTDQILCYNQFGHFNKTLSLSFDKVQLFNKQLLFLKDNTIKRHSLEVEYLFEEEEIIYDAQEPIIDFKLSKSGILYVLTKSEVRTVQIK